MPLTTLPVILCSYFSHLPSTTYSHAQQSLGICLLNLTDPFPSIQPIYALVQPTISHLDFCNKLLAVTLPLFLPPHCSQVDLKLIMSVCFLNLQWLTLHYQQVKSIFLQLVFKASHSLILTALSSLLSLCTPPQMLRFYQTRPFAILLVCFAFFASLFMLGPV